MTIRNALGNAFYFLILLSNFNHFCTYILCGACKCTSLKGGQKQSLSGANVYKLKRCAMRKKIISVVLTFAVCLSLSIPAFASGMGTVNRFGVHLSDDEYTSLLNQGWSDQDIDYMSRNEADKYLSETGRELLYVKEKYYICKKDGSAFETSEANAENYAQMLNNVMPASQSDSDDDGVCMVRLAVSEYRGKYRSVATAEWLTSAPPTENTKDILSVLHSNGLLSAKRDMTATRWYDYSNDGVRYRTQVDDITSFKSETGGGIACDFAREVRTPKYNAPCKNFRYRTIIESEKNSNGDTRKAVIDANFYRGIKKISVSANLSLSIKPSSAGASLTISPKYESKFAQVLQAEAIVDLNI